jgi:hypothetical protein
MTKSPNKTAAGGAILGVGILLACLAIVSAQIPAQFPGQGPGPAPNPTPPPFHIPHLGGSHQEEPTVEESAEGPVYVMLWFDVDDYIQPQSDDAAKRLAVFLTQEGIPATFKIVGEKARALTQRERQDVITALAQHDIGYASNTYSQHPTVTEYEADLNWEAGAEEFSRRERPGYDDVARTFRKPVLCYGQPGDAWAPQVFPALDKWGVRVYLGEGKQVGLRGRPFWYGGLVNVFNTRDGEMLRPDETWSNLDSAKLRFQDTYVNLTSRKTGGLISIYFRSSEFVNKEPWDEVNFRNGANPSASEWTRPALKSTEDSEKAFQYFEGLVHFLKSFPRIQFLTASAAAERFRDRAQMHVFSDEEVGAIAGQVDSNVSFQTADGFSLSPSQVFYIINKYLAGTIQRQSTESLILDGTPEGPDSAGEPLKDKVIVPWAQAGRTVVDVQDYLAKTGRIPSVIWLGSQQIPPESYLVGIARVAQSILQNAEPPATVTFEPARLAAADYVADDSPDLWDWAIFPKGFHAPKMMSLAKLQAWTLKPALK